MQQLCGLLRSAARTWEIKRIKGGVLCYFTLILYFPGTGVLMLWAYKIRDMSRVVLKPSFVNLPVQRGALCSSHPVP